MPSRALPINCGSCGTPEVRKIHDQYNELRLNMEGGYAVVFRALQRRRGLSIRDSHAQEKVKIYGEESAFNFPRTSSSITRWKKVFFSHNERKISPNT